VANVIANAEVTLQCVVGLGDRKASVMCDD
jgi:hypothetical protein